MAGKYQEFLPPWGQPLSTVDTAVPPPQVSETLLGSSVLLLIHPNSRLLSLISFKIHDHSNVILSATIGGPRGAKYARSPPFGSKLFSLIGLHSHLCSWCPLPWEILDPPVAVMYILLVFAVISTLSFTEKSIWELLCKSARDRLQNNRYIFRFFKFYTFTLQVMLTKRN